jgi:hypothetical protein
MPATTRYYRTWGKYPAKPKRKPPKKLVPPVIPKLTTPCAMQGVYPVFACRWALHTKAPLPVNNFGKVVLYPPQPVAVVSYGGKLYTATYTTTTLAGGCLAWLYRNWQGALYVTATLPLP